MSLSRLPILPAFLLAPVAIAASAAAQLPQVDSVSPTFAQFPSVITITGQNLAGATAITFGSSTGSFVGLTDTQILATVPPTAPGFADVSVTTPAGTASFVDAAEFLPNLTVSGGTELAGPLELTLRNGGGGVAILAYSLGAGAPVSIGPWHYGLELNLGQGFGLLGNFPIPASGTGTVAIDLPVVPALVGQELFYQSFATLQPAGFLVGGSFSNTVSAVITGFAFEPPTNLAYASELAQYPLGFAIEPNFPMLDSFANAWSVAPALSAGLTINASTGEITGAPTALQPLTTYTVTAGNEAGSTTSSLQLGVVPPINALLDPNSGGLASELRIGEIRYGRSVDVYSQSSPSAPLDLVYPDLVIGQGFLPAPSQGHLDRSEATGRERLILLTPNTVQPNEPFDSLVQAATESAQVLSPQAALELAQGFVPRNACFSVRFDDLVNADTFNFNVNFRLMVETIHNPVASNLWPRTRFSPNWGGFSGMDGSFKPTRLIVDLTFDAAERFPGFSTTILPLSGAGIPPFEDAPDFPNNLTDVAMRFATQADPASGVFEIISNLSGAQLTASGNGPIDTTITTVDAVRAFRAGQPEDFARGFLVDSRPPNLQLQLDVLLDNLVDDPAGIAGLDYLADVSFLDDACFLAPEPGDGFRAIGAFQRLYTVTAPGTVAGTAVIGMQLRRESHLSFDAVGSEQARLIRTAGSSLPSIDLACLVRDAIAPFGSPVGILQPSAIPVITFDEPMYAPDAVGYDGLQLFREALPMNPSDVVPVEVSADLSFRSFLIQPLLHLAHANNSEDYFLQIAPASEKPLRDLVGNVLSGGLLSIPLAIDSSANAVDNGGWILRFDEVDEGGPVGSEASGNFTYNLANGTLSPRPVSRFSSVIDDASTPGIAAMSPVPGGLQTPLSGLGSKLHQVWRAFDMGLPVGQQTTGFEDLDVEGLALAVQNGSVVVDFYPEFEILAGHSSRLPDESLNPLSLLPEHPFSGFLSNASFAENYLGDEQLLHERSKGFLVSPLGVFQSATGTAMLRLPLNQDANPGEESTFTWRDLSVRERGALKNNNTTETEGPGIPLQREVELFGLNQEPGQTWGGMSASAGVPAGVPTNGLPLLLEYRCFPSDSISLNSFRASLAITSSAAPFFRAFSTGGFDISSAAITKDPDLQPSPTGGFNGNPGNPPLGAPTLPRDPSVYLGQVDFVVRVSRVHTSLQTAVGFSDPDYRGVSLDAIGLEGDAQVLVAFRGHDPTLGANQPADDASQLDAYGDLLTGPLLASQLTLYPPLEFSTSDWSDSIDDLDGTSALQLRLTFINDLTTGQSPRVSAVGVAYE